MPLPEPKPGLVIRYDFLWQEDAPGLRGEGSKIRPCAIVVAVASAGGQTHVLVAPITHSAPRAGTPAIEIPGLVRERLGLDGARSWIITDQLNRFLWPGPDLHAVPGRSRGDDGRFAYGFLGPNTTAAMIESVRAQRSRGVRRD